MQYNNLLMFLQFLIFGDRCELIAGKALTGYNIHPVRYREYPNVVCIAGLSKNLLEEDVWCTGTMISYLHALTSEHCFDDVENEGFRLICGSNELFRGVSYYPEWWISFDQWSNAHNLEIQYPINDIAVIKLFGSIIPQIQPARLSSFTENSQLFGFRAITVGWGQTNRGAMPTVLQASNLTISTNTQCEKIYFELTGERRHLGERYICSSSFPYTHLGDGDSGGPLLYNGELIAINKGTTPNLPDFHHNLQNIHVFINVYRNFVDSVLSM